jgi:hypothetical protein
LFCGSAPAVRKDLLHDFYSTKNVLSQPFCRPWLTSKASSGILPGERTQIYSNYPKYWRSRSLCWETASEQPITPGNYGPKLRLSRVLSRGGISQCPNDWSLCQMTVTDVGASYATCVQHADDVVHFSPQFSNNPAVRGIRGSSFLGIAKSNPCSQFEHFCNLVVISGRQFSLSSQQSPPVNLKKKAWCLHSQFGLLDLALAGLVFHYFLHTMDTI